MGRIAGWWLGASTCVSRSKLWELATAAGGWSALRSCGRGELIALGVDASTADRWLGMADGETLGRAVTRGEERYPSGLRGDEQAPPVLYCEGDLSLLQAPCAVAIVGTRRCSGRGAALARALGRELGAAGVVVVSGLARGIDTAAHAGALAGRGPTIAVLGHGLGHTSPASNRGLRRRIVEGGGLVVSGWGDGVRPERWTFPARNRWIAGLSAHTVVVEAPARSGALITARDALTLGRTVWAVAGRPDDPLAEGPLALLHDQAEVEASERRVLRLRVEELLEVAEGRAELTPSLRDAVRSLGGPVGPRVRPLRSIPSFLEGVVGERPAQESAWVAQLLAGATLDQVARNWGRSVTELQGELTRRELAGELVRLPGGRYARAS